MKYLLIIVFLRDTPGTESITVLVGRERRTGVLIAHVVPHKGDVELLVKELVRDLRKLGAHKVI